MVAFSNVMTGTFDHGQPPSHGYPKNPHFSADDWSSLIGIVTAIVGNILISVALNTQRYAHVRLGREAEERYSKIRAQEAGTDNVAQAKLAERRASIHSQSGKSEANGHAHNDDEDVRETDPLLPRHGDSDIESDTSSIRSGEKVDEQRQRKNYLRSPYWWIGIALMVIGEAGNFLAYGFAPASIVSPLGVVALVSNCLIAPFMLKEKFRKRDFLGVVIAVAGAVAVVLSAKGSNPKLGPDRIWDLIKRWEFLTYLGITVLFIVILSVASNKYGHKTILIDIGLVGLFGGYTALATKGVASLFSYRLFDIFTFWISYVLVIVLVVTAVLQIKYVNRALQRFNSTQVIPTQFVVFTVFVVVGSAVLYRDFEKTDAKDVGQFVGGVALTFLGVWCITGGRSQEDTGTDYDEAGEQGIDLIDEEATDAPSTPSNPKAYRPTAVKTTPASSNYQVDSPDSFATATSHLGTPADPIRPPLHPSISTPADSVRPNQQSRSQSNLHAPTTPSRLSRQFNNTQSSSSIATAQPSPVPESSTASSSVPRQYLNRHSIATGITPGPYISPLNAGVGMVLSDGRRRSSVSTPQTVPQNQGSPRPVGRRRSGRQRMSAPDLEADPVNGVEDPLRRESAASTVGGQSENDTR